MTKIIRLIVLLVILQLPVGISLLFAQGLTTASGIVKDSITGEPLSYVSVIFENSTIGVMTDDDGKFATQNDKGFTSIQVLSLGYNSKKLVVTKGAKNENLEILLRPTSFEISEVVIKPQKDKYSKKDNPAVELIRKVIERKDLNRIEVKPEYKVEKYEKLSLALDNFNPNLDKNAFTKKFNFIKNYLDTSEFNGKPILTVSVRETLSDMYYRKNPKSEKNIIKGKRMQGVEESIDEGGITANLEEIFQSINIFDNNINILLNRFVSPLSSTLATSYYKYYIEDTVMVGNNKCVDLSFVPFNSESYGFTGRLYITMDGDYAVKKVLLNIPAKINLNWVEKLRITQEFNQLPDSTWVLSEENTLINFVIVKGSQALYAHQLRTYKDYDFTTQNDSIFKLLGTNIEATDGIEKPDTFWVHNRPVPLKEKESALDDLLAQLRKVPVFNVIIKTAEILLSGYIQTGNDRNSSKFDFGPMNTTFGGNSIEGFRFRVGGMTTANFHKNFFLDGYVAYGTDDRKFKYNGTAIWSFDDKKYHPGEYPRNNLSFTYEYDLYTPGQNFLFTSKDNMFVSLKVGMPITKYSYMRKSFLSYEKEWLNGLSFKSWMQHLNDEPTGTLRYREVDRDGNFLNRKSITTAELGVQLRFAPGERPYNGRAGKNSPFNLSKDAPIMKVSHQMGFDGVLGGQYKYNHTEVSAEKRIWLSSFGHIDAKVKAGKVWDKVPFPLLILPNANQSLTIQPESFHMMNALEFVADQYVNLDVTYYLKGWILNRIPGINWLKLREVVSFNGIYGGLTKKNNPALTPGLFILPDGTRPLGNQPYMEASVGLENIFKILRIDYYRRLTYLNEPGIKKGGVRILLKFSF